MSVEKIKMIKSLKYYMTGRNATLVDKSLASSLSLSLSNTKWMGEEEIDKLLSVIKNIDLLGGL